MLQLPTVNPRPVKPTFRGAKQNFTLSKNLITKLKQLNRQEGVTLFMTLLATFNTLLYRYSGQDDMVIGSVFDCHNRPELENVMGNFVNTLVLRTDMSGNPTFKQLLARVREVTLGAYSHHDLPFQKLVEVLNPARNANQNPFFEVALTVEPPVMSALDSDLDWKSYQYDDGIDTNTARFDLSLGFEERTFEIIGRIEYSTDLFEAATIERMIGHFQTLLEGIVTNPLERISELPLLTSLEQHQLVEWNDTQTDYPKDKCVHQLFEAQVEITPEAIAVVFEEQQLTYRELNTKANQLAHYLQTLSVKPDELVGLCVEASLEMIVGLLGILKAGGAYVPLDPNYPPERLAFMFSNAQAKVLLTQQKWLKQLPQLEQPIFCLDSDWAKISKPDSANLTRIAQPDHLIYVIYTSGSTGKPKGAGIYHRGFTNLVNWFVTDFTLTAADSVLVISSFSFDLTQKNFFAPLIVGGQLHLLPQGDYDPKSILQTVHEQKITWLNCTPSAFYPLMEPSENRTFQKLTSLRYVFLGGEPITNTKLLPWLQSTACQAKVVNTYGPTECSDVCALYLLPPPFLEPAIPIGKPISNAKLFILGKHLDRLPIGVAGELHIGGVGLGVRLVSKENGIKAI
jgi:amino acid adenylation domain-containing protein